MKKLSPTLLVYLIFLLPNLVMGVTFDDLVERYDLYDEKFNDVPFTGEVTGKEQGSIENGKREGAWVSYYKVNYKDALEKSALVQIHKNRTVWEYIE